MKLLLIFGGERITEFVLTNFEDEKRAHEKVTLAYTFALSGIKIAPGSTGAITSIMDNVLNLPMNLVPDQDAADPSTPWGMSKLIVEQMSEYYSKSDGWNEDGSLLSSHNKMPFSDFEYDEEYSPYEVSTTEQNDDKCNKEWFWEPLLETN